jgi:hypothetical protein
MEFYGSIGLVSGSVTASVLSGSFQGDGSGLYNVQASGVTGLNLSQIANGSNTASVSSDGFNIDTDTSITGSLKVSGTITAEQYNVTVVSSSVLYQSGSTKFGDSIDDRHDITGSVNITGSISLNGEAIGTGKLNETTFNSYVTASDSKLSNIETSIGSLNSFTSSINTTIKSKLDSENVVSGSAQVNITGTTGYSTFSSSINTSIGDVNSTLTNLSSSVATTTNNLSSSIATTDLSQNNRLDSIESKSGSYATTGSNLFKGTQTHSGSILPSVDNAYDLGSATHQWKDVYISSGSLYIDGTKVLSSTNQELTFTTDTGQSFKILESTTDNITLQTADGDIELKSSADGDILLDPTNGKIMLKGPVEVLSGQKIQSSVGGTPVVFANDIVVSGSIDITGTIEGINLTDFSSSVNTRIGNTETSVSSLNSFSSSANSRIGSLEIESGSVRTTLNSYTSSANGRLSSIETTTGSIITTNTTQNSRLDSIEGKSGSYATTGSNVFQGNQTITGSLFISQNLIVGGSSSINFVSQSTLNIGTNLITVNAQNPGTRFGGLSVIDSGSSPTVSGSILFDSTNDQWIFVHQAIAGSPITSSVLMMGPQTFNSLGAEIYPTTNRIVKSVNAEHLGDSNISDNGTTVTILSNAVVNGTFSATGTTLISGSSQISFNGITDKPALVSGSAQVSFSTISDKPALVSGSSQITFSGISGLPTLVSGSSQISYTGLSNIPGGIVSGSAQVDLTATTNYSTGIKTRLNAEGVISGSSQVTGIGNAQLTNSSFHVGTTSISLGRASASQTLTGVSIDGNAATVTSGVYTSGDQTIAGIKTFSNRVVFNSAVANRPQLPGGMLGLDTGDGDFDIWGISRDYYPSHATAANAWGLRWNGANNDFEFVGGGTSRVILDMDAGNITATGALTASNYSGTHSGTSSGTNTGDQTNISGTASNITAYTINQNVGSSNAPTFAGGTINGSLYVNANNDITTLAGSITLYSSGNATTSMIMFKNTTGLGYGNHGAIAGTYNTYFVMDTTDRGWIFRNATTSANVASISNTGIMASSGQLLSARLNFGDTGATPYNNPTGTGCGISFGGWESSSLRTYGIFTEQENIGGNYSKLTFNYHTGIRLGASSSYGGTRFYNNYAGGSGGGSEIFSVGNGDNNVRVTANLLPTVNNNSNLGSASFRWANLFTNDLHLSNEGKEGGNEIDGTTGDWTIQEGNENLYIINNKNGKKFKIDLTEII